MAGSSVLLYALMLVTMLELSVVRTSQPIDISGASYACTETYIHHAAVWVVYTVLHRFYTVGLHFSTFHVNYES